MTLTSTSTSSVHDSSSINSSTSSVHDSSSINSRDDADRSGSDRIGPI